MRKMLIFCLVLIQVYDVYAQASRIYLDGFFNDWSAQATSYTHPSPEQATGLGLQKMSITNDERYLYIRIALRAEVGLQESSIQLFIDSDNNSSTGAPLLNRGIDLSYHFGNKSGVYNGASIRHAAIGIVSLPTHSAREFEIAIDMQALPDNHASWLKSDTLHIIVRDEGFAGETLPAEQGLRYTVDRTALAPYEPVELAKEDPALLRIMNYNVYRDSPMQSHKQNDFIRMMRAIRPDVMAFNEFYNTTPGELKLLHNNILPTGTAEGWYAIKLDRDNITMSRYPILQSWLVYSGSNITASLIQLPQSQLLVINCHFRCCTANLQRQAEADALVAFLHDARTPGGRLELPQGTPFIILGDLNLVGLRQQLTTLLKGDIQNTGTFGQGGPPDWDDTPLADLISYHTDAPVAYTWRNESEAFVPGRLDFMIFSSSALEPRKSFVLNTENMSLARLARYTLDKTDTDLSDHLPKVADFAYRNIVTGYSGTAESPGVVIYPNPASSHVLVQLEGLGVVSVYDIAGRLRMQATFNGEGDLNIAALQPGIYIVRVVNKQGVHSQKLVKQ